ncbi:MAG: hypothetical protein ACQESC_00935 [Nanobdellota archaeon]
MENTVIFEDELISAIKKKRELSSLDDSFVSYVLREKVKPSLFPPPKKYSSFKQFSRSSSYKEIISQARSYLRVVFGVFASKSLGELFSNTTSFTSEMIDSLLNEHKSTHERLPYYTRLYREIHDFCLENNLRSYSLVDICCGWNPFAISYFPQIPTSYTATDLSSKDMACIDYFFKKEHINGSAFGADVLSSSFASWLSSKKFDVCLLFKALDSLEYSSRNASKSILSLLSSRANIVIVSFSTVSIGGKKSIDTKKRSWFEWWCKDNGWTYEVRSLPNELFYFCLTPRD